MYIPCVYWLNLYNVTLYHKHIYRSVLGFFANAVIFILSGLLVCHNLVNVWYNIEDADKLATTFALITAAAAPESKHERLTKSF